VTEAAAKSPGEQTSSTPPLLLKEVKTGAVKEEVEEVDDEDDDDDDDEGWELIRASKALMTPSGWLKSSLLHQQHGFTCRMIRMLILHEND
jgi:hypothetical protein